MMLLLLSCVALLMSESDIYTAARAAGTERLRIERDGSPPSPSPPPPSSHDPGPRAVGGGRRSPGQLLPWSRRGRHLPRRRRGLGSRLVVVGRRGPRILRGGRRWAVAVQLLAVAEPVRVPEAPGLEHVRAVPAQPPAAAVAVAVQRRARAGVPQVHGSVRQDQGAHAGVPLLRASQPARAVPVPAPPGLGLPRRAHRPPPRRLRGERRHARDEPLRRARRAALPARGARDAGAGQGDQLREEEAQEAVGGFGRGGGAVVRGKPATGAVRRRRRTRHVGVAAVHHAVSFFFCS